MVQVGQTRSPTNNPQYAPEAYTAGNTVVKGTTKVTEPSEEPGTTLSNNNITWNGQQTFTQPISMQIPSSNQNTTPWNCTAIGYQALANNTGASNNAFGQGALYNNTTGFLNDALGQHCLYNNTTGTYNVAVGIDTLFNNTTGNDNNAFAIDALFFNTTGSSNNAFGYTASYHNTTGGGNSAFGQSALYSNTIGYENCAFGQNALYNYNMTQPFPNAISNMCAFGQGAGYNYTGSEINNITIGNNGGIAGESNMLRIGQPNAYNSPSGQVAFSMVNLSGFGLSPTYSFTSQKVETGSDTSILSYTPPAVAGVYMLQIAVDVSAIGGTSPSLALNIAYKDSNSVSVSKSIRLDDLGSATGTLGITTTGNYYATIPLNIDNSATAITLSSVLTGTSPTIAYKVSATLKQNG